MNVPALKKRPMSESSIVTAQNDSATIAQRVSGLRFITGALTAVIGKLGYAVLAYCSLVVAARLLQPTRFGLYVLGVSWINSLAIVGALGSPNTVLALVPKYTRTDVDKARNLLSLLLRAVWIVSATLAVVVIVFAVPLTRALGQPAAAPYFRVLAVALPFAAILAVTRAGLQAAHAYSSSVFTSILLQPLVFQVALLVLALGTVSPLAIPAAYSLSFAFAAVVAVATLHRENAVGRIEGKRNSVSEPGMTALALRFIAINFFLNPQWSVVIYVIAFILPADRVGLFSAAQRTAGLISFVLVGINFVFAPLIAALWHTGERQELGQLYRNATRWSLAISLPVCIGLIAAGPGVMTLFGASYRTAVPALAWFALGQLINAGTGSVAYLLMMVGKEREVLINTVAMTAVSGLAAALIVPRFGVTGAAAVVGIVVAGFNILMVLQVKHFLGIVPYDRNAIRVLAAGAVAAVAGYSAYNVAWHSGFRTLIGLLISLGSVGLVYVSAFLLLALTAEDRRFFQYTVLTRLRTVRDNTTSGSVDVAI